jgi:GNAT superfamily N-acetyltransferase
MTTSTAVPAGYAIERVTLASAPDDLMHQVVALEHARGVEAHPEDPPYPDAMIEGRFRATSEMWLRSEWIAKSGDRVVGRINVSENRTGSNEHIREVDLIVHPEHRRRGVGRALFSAGVMAISSADAKLVEGWTISRVPAGKAFAERLGAKKGLNMRESQLDLAKVDLRLMDEWAAIDPGGYRLVWIDNEIPDALMDVTLEALRAINRMPREDLEMEDWKFTEANQRDWERVRRAQGREQWLIVAVHEATNAGAGFTNVVFDPRYPHVIGQGGTAVDPAHQGKGVGKWMKAQMVKRLQREMPQARYIRTDNAGTNAAMLAINVAMGFKPAWESVIWQIPLEDARRYVR